MKKKKKPQKTAYLKLWYRCQDVIIISLGKPFMGFWKLPVYNQSEKKKQLKVYFLLNYTYPKYSLFHMLQKTEQI